MTLREQIETDVSEVLLNTDEFAETVVYHPSRYYEEEASQDRSIAALVTREEVESFADQGAIVAPVWRVRVANSSTIGISSDEIDVGADSISFPPRVGQDAERKRVVRLVSHTRWTLILECR